MANILSIIVFLGGYIGITVEHKIKMSKSAFALLMGGLLWVIAAVSNTYHFHEDVEHAAIEIFEIVAFLLFAMSLVEVLIHYQFFDVLRGKIQTLGLSEKQQFIVLYFLTFFLSGVIDNLTVTIVMVQIARKFFRKPNLLVVISGIVIVANAGGAFSPLGDVTTIMMWLAGKYSAMEIITQGFLPSFVLAMVALFFLVRLLKPIEYSAKNEIITILSKSERLVIAMTFGSFILPLLMSFLDLPPYIGLLIGLSLVWITIDVFKQISERRTHLEASIEKFVQQTDLAAIKFFIGILLAVSALSSMGLLDYVADSFYGVDHGDETRVILGNVGLGLISPILDNVPLTAIAIDSLHTSASHLWVLLAITVGTGGSLLIIGSAAGVIAMGMVKELTFAKYFKIAFIPSLVGFFVAVGVWYLQMMVF